MVREVSPGLGQENGAHSAVTAAATVKCSDASPWAAREDAHWAATRDSGDEVLRRIAMAESISMMVTRGADTGCSPERRRGLPRTDGPEHLGEAGLHRLHLEHSTRNGASCRVAGKAGFLPEGTPSTPTAGTTCTCTPGSAATSNPPDVLPELHLAAGAVSRWSSASVPIAERCPESVTYTLIVQARKAASMPAAWTFEPPIRRPRRRTSSGRSR